MNIKIKKPIFWAIFGAVVVLATIIVLFQVNGFNREEDIFALIGRQSASHKTQFIQQSGWKTYRNEELGFEFRYPSFEEKNNIKIAKDEKFETISFKNFMFIVYPNQEKLNLKEWFSKKIDYKDLLISNATFIFEKKNGVDTAILGGGIPIEYSDYAGPIYVTFFTIPPSRQSIVGFSINGQDNELDKYGYGGPEGYQRFEDEILSTFKFINSTDTANWKTYRNEELGFEFRYPANTFAFDETKLILTHKLQNFHKYSAKDGSDLGLATDISLAFKPGQATCDYLEDVLKIQNLGVSFTLNNINGVSYEMGAEGEGVVDYCIKDKVSKNIFAVERTFLNESYGANLLKQSDYIPSAEQSRLANQILSTFKFIPTP